jgi:two-component system LytT family response regulator
MIRTIVIDDESKSRETTVELLRRYCPQVDLLKDAASGEEAYPAIMDLKPDLVLLDIEMPYEDGFSFLKRFDRIPFEVIFITAYNQYAIQAIRVCALDYLLKPLSITDLKNAVARVNTGVREKKSDKKYEMLLHNIAQTGQASPGKLAIPTRDGLEFLDMKDIIVLEADGGYTTIKLSGGKKTVSTRNLKEYEDILPDTLFFRAHHSYMININHIRNYHKGEGGYVVMSDLSSIDISKRKKKEFLERFGM